MSLGEKLKKIRLENDLSMDELAKILNDNYNLTINKSMISRWENNKAEPYNTYLSAYARQFNVDLNYLLGIENKYYENLDDDMVVLARGAKTLTPEQRALIKNMIDQLNKQNEG